MVDGSFVTHRMERMTNVTSNAGIASVEYKMFDRIVLGAGTLTLPSFFLFQFLLFSDVFAENLTWICCGFFVYSLLYDKLTITTSRCEMECERFYECHHTKYCGNVESINFGSLYGGTI